jgi:hypothetical protein
MNRYLTTQTLTVAADTVLELTADQARRRKHQIEPVKDKEGQYRTKTLVQFKRGETFGMEGELPKGHEAFAEWLNKPAVEGQESAVQTSAPAAGTGQAKAPKAAKPPKAKKAAVPKTAPAPKNKK